MEVWTLIWVQGPDGHHDGYFFVHLGERVVWGANPEIEIAF